MAERRREDAGERSDVVSIRLSAAELGMLQELAEYRGVTVSQVARDAITTALRGGAAAVAAAPWTGTSTNGLDLFAAPQGPTARTSGAAVKSATA